MILDALKNFQQNLTKNLAQTGSSILGKLKTFAETTDWEQAKKNAELLKKKQDAEEGKSVQFDTLQEAEKFREKYYEDKVDPFKMNISKPPINNIGAAEAAVAENLEKSLFWLGEKAPQYAEKIAQDIEEFPMTTGAPGKFVFKTAVRGIGGLIGTPATMLGEGLSAIRENRPVKAIADFFFGAVGSTYGGAIFNAIASQPAVEPVVETVFGGLEKGKEFVKETPFFQYEKIKKFANQNLGVREQDFDDTFNVLADVAAFLLAKEGVKSIGKDLKEIGGELTKKVGNIKVGGEKIEVKPAEAFDAVREITTGNKGNARPEVVNILKEKISQAQAGGANIGEIVRKGFKEKVGGKSIAKFVVDEFNKSIEKVKTGEAGLGLQIKDVQKENLPTKENHPFFKTLETDKQKIKTKKDLENFVDLYLEKENGKNNFIPYDENLVDKISSRSDIDLLYKNSKNFNRLVFGGSKVDMYTNTYILVEDKKFAKELNEKNIDYYHKQSVKDYINAGVEKNKSEKLANEFISKERKNKDYKFPDITKTEAISNAPTKETGSKLTPQIIYNDGKYAKVERSIILTDNKSQISLDLNYYNLFKKNFPDAKFFGRDYPIGSVSVYSGDKRVGIIMSKNTKEFPVLPDYGVQKKEKPIKKTEPVKVKKPVETPLEKGKKVSEQRKKLNEQFPEQIQIEEKYQTKSNKRTIEEASKYIKSGKSPMDVITGKIEEGETTRVAVASVAIQKALQEKNYDYAKKLFTATADLNTFLGQNLQAIKMLHENNPEFYYVNSLIKNRMADYNMGTPQEMRLAKKERVEKVKKDVEKIKRKKTEDAFEKFLDDFIC